jgi:hypothetical protein
MMNIIKVQDSLKNFSEDQLVKEMQQPTGNAPQFLVLSELNRRKRVKGDFEARQAENQPTVAEEAVAAAGVPQDQMMGMPEAMAPQSAVSEGVGTSAPMKMATGGLAQFGQEIRSGMGQDIDPYLDGVQNEAEQKFGVQLGQLGPSPGYRGPSQFAPQDPRGPRIPDSMGGLGGKGLPRPAVLRNDVGFMGESNMKAIMPFRGGAEMMHTTTSMADGGVVRAANGFRGVGQGGYDTRGDAFRSPGDPTISDDFENTGNVDVGGLFGFGQEDARTLQEILKSGPKTMEELEILEKSEKETEARSPLPITQEVPEKPNIQPEVEVDSANKPLTIEEELLKRQAGLDKSKNFDKWMALAQAGMGILSSNSPTLAGAIGEGGTAGLTAFSEANKRYEDGLTDVLNARSKMETARLTAAGKGRLTRSSAIQAINTYNTSISSKEKLIQDLMKNNFGNVTPEVQTQIDAIKKSIADLTYQQSQLFGAGKIRPRPSINVGKLPSTQKAS